MKVKYQGYILEATRQKRYRGFGWAKEIDFVITRVVDDIVVNQGSYNTDSTLKDFILYLKEQVIEEEDSNESWCLETEEEEEE